MSTLRARELRANMTRAEVRLWARLKRLRTHGFHFRRQSPFRGYFLDFVCFDRRLVVELDGGQHGEPVQAEHDAVRDLVLRREGLQVLRFRNGLVLNQLDVVMDTIVRTLQASTSVRGASGDS